MSSNKPVSVDLYFDGSASPNPGPASWGATATVTRRQSRKTLEWSAPIGHATNNAAEYIALISGLRRLQAYLQAQNIRNTSVNLDIYGDSAVVIDQLTRRMKVTSPYLIPLYDLAYVLVSRFHSVHFVHISRDENRDADYLANEARFDDIEPWQTASYSPSPRLVDVWVNQVHTVASHDLHSETSDSNCFIDSMFLQSFPEGRAIFNNMQDSHPISVVISDLNLPVLGTVSMDLSVMFSRQYQGTPQSQPDSSVVIHDAIVVHCLPVPFHVSHRHPYVPNPRFWSNKYQLPFSSEYLDEPYCKHPYWFE